MLAFQKQRIHARLVEPSDEVVERPIEVRIHPITGRACRITFSRSAEREPGTEGLPEPPPFAADRSGCPFCQPRVETHTPRLVPQIEPTGRMRRGRSLLFPNLYPYGGYSAVSLFDEAHFVEIGKADPAVITDCFLNCRDYLLRVLRLDPGAVFTAITQNHLPSAGGSLLHPHLQVHADRVPSNHHRFLEHRADEYRRQTSRLLFSDYLAHEREDGSRFIGRTGDWQWLSAFAPEGFFEIWGILPEVGSLGDTSPEQWNDLARGVVNTQKFYRSLSRNGYNLGLLSVEDGSTSLELRVVLVVRSNYAPWVRSDHTGFEVMLGDMATFTAPEDTARRARAFWGMPRNPDRLP
jgi:galactose-1-phosphate uridylyltransferase